jgi:hypothetical protein
MLWMTTARTYRNQSGSTLRWPGAGRTLQRSRRRSLRLTVSLIKRNAGGEGLRLIRNP